MLVESVRLNISNGWTNKSGQRITPHHFVAISDWYYLTYICLTLTRIAKIGHTPLGTVSLFFGKVIWSLTTLDQSTITALKHLRIILPSANWYENVYPWSCLPHHTFVSQIKPLALNVCCVSVCRWLLLTHVHGSPTDLVSAERHCNVVSHVADSFISPNRWSKTAIQIII